MIPGKCFLVALALIALVGCGGDIHEAKHETRPSPPKHVIGDCSGFPLPEWMIQRLSGGDPNVVNYSSGAFGCAQLMPENFARHGFGNVPGKCYGLPTTLDGQRRCTKVLLIFYGLRAWGFDLKGYGS